MCAHGCMHLLELVHALYMCYTGAGNQHKYSYIQCVLHDAGNIKDKNNGMIKVVNNNTKYHYG